MTQEGIVTKLFPSGMAEVKTLAKNLVSAQPGQRVLIESRSSAVFGAIFLVYVMPLVFFLLGYGAASLAGLREGLCILCSFIGLAFGALLLVLSQKRKKKKEIEYDIIKCL